MISDRNPFPGAVEPPADEMPGRDVSGLARGIVWSDLAAEMRAEAEAAGDDRFERADAMVSWSSRVEELEAMIPDRPAAPFEARPIDLERARAARDAVDDERAA
ncbi:hypothetical protein [Actinomycetospora atypica]|uniref:Uncharacterized protein n=1 Tax=Actinomycetospora atypica TaxID=1290095 RepID=A0ABV9YR25_9PSEU